MRGPDGREGMRMGYKYAVGHEVHRFDTLAVLMAKATGFHGPSCPVQADSSAETAEGAGSV